MNKREAYKALLNGQKIRSYGWLDSCFLHMDDKGEILDENGSCYGDLLDEEYQLINNTPQYDDLEKKLDNLKKLLQEEIKNISYLPHNGEQLAQAISRTNDEIISLKRSVNALDVTVKTFALSLQSLDVFYRRLSDDVARIEKGFMNE